ncbi:MAG: hypothetical protein GF317_04615 [Candidatus Lokiarchaeota archaeon]|nr:hypothetical protein [Candidatus Lokiarchaeota archaeon]
MISSIITMEQIKKYLQFVKKAKSWSLYWRGHKHWVYVSDLAEEIYKLKGGNFFVIKNAALLHEVGRVTDGMQKNCSLSSADLAKEILAFYRIRVDIDCVYDIIANLDEQEINKELLGYCFLEYIIVKEADILTTMLSLGVGYEEIKKMVYFKDDYDKIYDLAKQKETKEWLKVF